jgi:hypothetical protein
MDNEFILCAAVWFPVKLKFEFQPDDVETGLVICGLRHGNCFAMKALLCDSLRDIIKHVPPKQGFLTNKNRFVDRFEAARIAKAANQAKDIQLGDELVSEDLW